MARRIRQQRGGPGWSVIAIYGSASDASRRQLLTGGVFRGNALTLKSDGFASRRLISTGVWRSLLGKATSDSTPLDGFSEAFGSPGRPSTTASSSGSEPTVQPYDGTVNTSGVATSYGVGADTFHVTALLAPGQPRPPLSFSAGGDLVLLAAQVVSATSEPVVDLSLTKTRTGNFTVGGTNVYTLTVANAAGWQREDNAVVVDGHVAGRPHLRQRHRHWLDVRAAAQVVTCTHPPTLNLGARCRRSR